MISELPSGFNNLRSLFADVKCKSNIPDLAVTDISSNSHNILPGGLFLACAGKRKHGLEYIDQAIASNVAAIAWEPSCDYQSPNLPENIISLEVQNLSGYIGQIADHYFGNPSNHLSVTGVTGTNGKTTVARLASTALSTLGSNSGYMGTIGYGIGNKIKSSELTTPGCILVHKRLRYLADLGATSVVMEVSSHGLDQGRIDGVKIKTAALTNLTRDHLDYHSSFSEYAEAKAKLFSHSEMETAVVNMGDSFGADLVRRNITAKRIISVAVEGSGIHANQVDLFAQLLKVDKKGLEVRLSGSFGTSEFFSPIWGKFNLENLSIVTGILLAHGFSLEESTAVLSKLKLPEGRMQVLRPKIGPTVVVDFAHTPAALKNVIEALRDYSWGNIICVFGCGGERDKGKRSLMGAAAFRYADKVIITDDNPRHEDSELIFKDILSGVSDSKSIVVIKDRAVAIQTAINSASSKDVILIAGKGSEDYQIIRDKRINFSDLGLAASFLEIPH
ncbi:MAG: UDP-N-acetylmuramoyl-L-alanyl-D-glutamate--2,6-diaminopimelate ligase [Pseudomonadota bacterium]|nr:UDP-N-acetylmuramoyl-L-alanyl-D-glutamate--2,6-diaminopimelate ligase [Pseudomonadota bacterium]